MLRCFKWFVITILSGIRLVGGSRCSGRLEVPHGNTWHTVCDAAFDQLDGGGSSCAGRVEVLHDGRWGTVGDLGWDLADVAVVCRELGCGEAVAAPKHAHFGQGKGPVWIIDVKCTGEESALKDCGSHNWGKHRANHADDAGVICSGVRLVGGSRCSGRLEILHANTRLSVCDAAFDQQDAEVVCRELDCGAPVQVLGAAAFNKEDAQMWTQEIECRGDESYISVCPTSSLKHNCTHENATGLEREVMKSGLMCLIVTGMKQNSQNVPSLHGVELNVLTN
uniref:SRCR domain-containing protein n=1 Tax=Sinocyclocheilus rhinocerous TaxID=307959 RepID=A0A673KI34_9TELE